jgi:diguanylate cyclase (GGDEF)-like protein
MRQRPKRSPRRSPWNASTGWNPGQECGRTSNASDKLIGAMASVVKDGGPADASLASRVVSAHQGYLRSIIRLFEAIHRHDIKATLRIDSNQSDPAYTADEETVDQAAERQHASCLARLAHLRHLDTPTGRLTPLVFVVGLTLAAALASITRGFQRLRNVERAQAIHDSLHDPLTGLPNRKLLDHRLSQALLAARRAGTTVGLLLIDLDRFKEINDTFGHQFGDNLLAQVGPRLVAAIREVDTVARLGGDDFAILLPSHTDVETATLVADEVRTTLATAFRVENVDFDVEASIGIVISGDHGQDAELLLRRADIAMYVAKTQNLGRLRV